MSRLLIMLLGVFGGNIVSAQSPVKWSFEAKKINENEYELIYRADIADGWAIYSQYLASDDGPIRTTIGYDQLESFQLKGKCLETGNIKEELDPLFDMKLIKIVKKGIFTQKIFVKDKSKPIKGTVTFMCCNENQCLPPKDVPFEISL